MGNSVSCLSRLKNNQFAQDMLSLVCNRWGEDELRKGNYSSAEDNFKNTRLENDIYINNLAECYNRQSKYKEAIDLFKQITATEQKQRSLQLHKDALKALTKDNTVDNNDKKTYYQSIIDLYEKEIADIKEGDPSEKNKVSIILSMNYYDYARFLVDIQSNSSEYASIIRKACNLDPSNQLFRSFVYDQNITDILEDDTIRTDNTIGTCFGTCYIA